MEIKYLIHLGAGIVAFLLACLSDRKLLAILLPALVAGYFTTLQIYLGILGVKEIEFMVYVGLVVFFYWHRLNIA